MIEPTHLPARRLQPATMPKSAKGEDMHACVVETWGPMQLSYSCCARYATTFLVARNGDQVEIPQRQTCVDCKLGQSAAKNLDMPKTVRKRRSSEPRYR